ncbi:related to fumarylacetoacetate hydrolase family protein [Phialocephala subalpina]|uniref:Fumarylacetoacetase n=1 Tax=Phialocephala subalpina TaxID=576137 RepID=A0A1L7XUP3_9HELO|nr:related to fumarylacetoacetate hydrolase family protein [Phialocephala subalpina]
MFAEHFSLANLPYGIATSETHPGPSIVTRLQDDVLFLSTMVEEGVLKDVRQTTANALHNATLNEFASLPRAERRGFRSILLQTLRDHRDEISLACVEHIDNVKMHLPIKVGEFSDFSCSKSHQLNCSEAVFGTAKLPPGFLHFPPGYAGRASSIVVSGTPIRRPKGQYRGEDGKATYGKTKELDYELEMACIIGEGSQQGESIPASRALDHVFGMVLLNDWSARDVQALEMVPTGPFSSKSFATSISSWVVTAEALEPFRAPLPSRDVAVAEYLAGEESQGSYNIHLKAELIHDVVTSKVCESMFDSLYWGIQHCVAHQTVNGCKLNTGDVLATGTVSGATRDSLGCFFEMSRAGKDEVKVEGGESRKYLEDGDSIRLSAFAGSPSDGVGFGECVGLVVA